MKTITIEQAVTHLKNGGAIELTAKDISSVRKRYFLKKIFLQAEVLDAGKINGTSKFNWIGAGNKFMDGTKTTKSTFLLSSISQDKTEEQQAIEWWVNLPESEYYRLEHLHGGWGDETDEDILRLYRAETTPQQYESVEEKGLEILKNILIKSDVRKHLNINNSGYSQVESDIVSELTEFASQQNELSGARDAFEEFSKDLVNSIRKCENDDKRAVMMEIHCKLDKYYKLPSPAKDNELVEAIELLKSAKSNIDFYRSKEHNSPLSIQNEIADFLSKHSS